MHDTLIVAFEKISTFKGKSSLSSWICSIAVNRALSNFRKNKKWKWIDIDDADLDASYDPHGDTLQAAPDLNRAMEAIRQLPEGYQMVLNLYAVENYSHQEIAQALDISVGTSKSQLARARKKLSEIIKKR